ncbi:MAG: tRNA (N6-threonylcarbamoyladenosine(37)-N6)-methyltransferase TrmO [Nitrososphaeria archaeon]
MVEPIGIVHVDATDVDIRTRGSAEGTVEIFQKYADGLYSLDGFSHIILVTYLHRVTEPEKKVLKVKFRRLQNLGISLDSLPEVGVFCSDSPHRPNPIGLSIVQVKRLVGNEIYVLGLDVYDGTPVLDIKPYTPFRRIDEIKVPGWFSRITSYVNREP